ncbi:MAG TPA: DNA replication/repair protein RecF [Acidimicrobiia bacterium]|nr:DNA replication/repair protein RecF [Acidimicrobiia bacterium]
MLLTWLQLRDFRCHPMLEFTPAPGVNVLLGGNGTGKSSVLEAIGFLATLASFRRAPDGALVRVGEESAVARGQFAGEAGTVQVEVEIPSRGRQHIRVDGKRAAGRAEVAARVALVAFLPDDLDLVKRGPAYRREYVDDLAVQLWPAAAGDQREYERALRQRNALLRREGRTASPGSLSVWDERLAALGAVLIRRRLDALGEVVVGVEGLCRELGGGLEQVSWSYVAAGAGDLDPTATEGALREGLAAAVAAARHEDLERRTTTVGPHRDEVALYLDGRDLRTRASQGEQRTVALALRLAAFDLLAERRRSAPVLVLDDVFSELDEARRARLVDRLPRAQVFISTAHREDVPVGDVCWAVSSGSIREAG